MLPAAVAGGIKGGMGKSVRKVEETKDEGTDKPADDAGESQREKGVERAAG